MYINVFRSRQRADIDAAAYSADAERMETLARQQTGFIGFKSFAAQDGEKLSMSEWETEEDTRVWQRQAEHAVVQAKGRGDYYESYTVYSCADPGGRRFDRSNL